MLNNITSAPKKAKNHVVRHRAKYAATATAAVCLTLNKRNVDLFNDFLNEKDLFDEFETFLDNK